MTLFLLLAGCVLNRTGQSASFTLQADIDTHDRRLAELEAVSEDMARRIGQLEEVTLARGQEEILKMETMEQLRSEVARVRGDFEVLQRDYQTYEQAGLGYQADSDWRMGWSEQRIEALERTLGVKAPPPPNRDGTAAVATPTTAAAAGTPDAAAAAAAAATPTPTPTAQTPDEYFALITQNLTEGKGAAARAVAQRFVTENPKSDRVPEALYRIAESFQNDGDFPSAATAFQDVVDRYPKSTWAPWSVLRQGECFAALGKTKEARLFWSDVVTKYPSSKAAKEAKAHLAEK
jgi:tol-pal system protein YbgF